MSSFEWRDFLQLAKDLKAGSLSSSSRESQLRSCISRAYYSQFVQIRYVFGRDKQPHTELMNALEAHNDSRVNLLGSDLKTLMEMRHEADYENHNNNLDDNSEIALSLAEDIMKRFASLEPIYRKI